MKPVHCLVATDEEKGTHGDCVRACVASILELPAEDVPHFFHDGDAEAGHARLSEWLSGKEGGLAPFYVAYNGNSLLIDILVGQDQNNPNAHYMLFGKTAEGEPHCVVCKGGEIVYNPAWIQSKIVAPIDDYWLILVIAVK